MYLEKLALVLAGVELALARQAGLLQLAECAGGGLTWRRRRTASAEVPLAVLLDAVPVVALVSATLAPCTCTGTVVRDCSPCRTWNKQNEVGRAALLRVPCPSQSAFCGHVCSTTPLTMQCVDIGAMTRIRGGDAPEHCLGIDARALESDSSSSFSILTSSPASLCRTRHQSADWDSQCEGGGPSTCCIGLQHSLVLHKAIQAAAHLGLPRRGPPSQEGR